jgi:outer membrane protein OmpA-like peptidoglycan-associated protein
MRKREKGDPVYKPRGDADILKEGKMRKISLFCVLTIVLWFLPASLEAEKFVYKHQTGDRYRLLSTVHEEVYIDRQLSHRSEILNRIAVEVRESRNPRVSLGGEASGKAGHSAVFQVAERTQGLAAGRSFQWSREYESEFERDAQGYITIDSKYYMPVVRNVPVFPDRDLKPGDTWTAEGHEAHDFRDSFGIAEPYRIPFTAEYTFLGNRVWRGKNYPAFSVSYRIFAHPEAVPGRTWPQRVMGASDQIIYWDMNAGQAAAYTESFRMIFDLSSGHTVEYRGTAEAELLDSPDMDKDELVKEITENIDRLGIADATVRAADEGIIISLENIQFEAESAELSRNEQQKLDKIGEILNKYSGRDILVGGHTALSGTPEGRLELSRERAAAVAEYLIGKKVRDPDRIVVRGYGAERPLADNGTEEGMRRNRRVEITILEN